MKNLVNYIIPQYPMFHFNYFLTKIELMAHVFFIIIIKYFIRFLLKLLNIQLNYSDKFI